MIKLANLVNIWSESNADLIGDDSTLALTLKNTSSGAGLSVDTSAGTGPGLLVTRNVSSATLGAIRITVSAASGAFFDFRGAVISTASLSLTGAMVVGLVKVWIQGSGGNNTGWLPIFSSAIAA